MYIYICSIYIYAVYIYITWKCLAQGKLGLQQLQGKTTMWIWLCASRFAIKNELVYNKDTLYTPGLTNHGYQTVYNWHTQVDENINKWISFTKPWNMNHTKCRSFSFFNQKNKIVRYFTKSGLTAKTCRFFELFGGIPTPLKNMKVSWGYYSQYMEQ